jgi:hypothetical protein
MDSHSSSSSCAALFRIVEACIQQQESPGSFPPGLSEIDLKDR